MEKNTKKMVTAALMAAFTCIATMIIKIPTPTLGYIHLGDGLVLLCGIVLGPWLGALSAGVGSMFSDIFSGYITWAPATLIIKALTAGIAGLLFRRLFHKFQSKSAQTLRIVLSGLIGETLMVLGYFLYEAGIAAFAAGSLTKTALAAGFTSSATGIPFNIAQGVMGIIIGILLLPILSKVPEIKAWIHPPAILSDQADKLS